MKLARTLLIWFAVLLAIAGAVVISPVTQTWWVNRALRQHGIAATVGSFWATPGSIEVENVQWTDGTRKLSVGKARANLAVVPALLHGHWSISHLVTKDFAFETLAGSEREIPKSEQPKASSTATLSPDGAAGSHRNSGPLGVSFGQVEVAQAELEGDLAISVPGMERAIRAHVVLTGGGVARGRTAEFAIDIAGVGGKNVQSAVAQGKFFATLDSAGAISRTQFDGTVTSPDHALPTDMTVSASATYTDEQGPQYEVQFRRGNRTPLSLACRFQPDAHEISGRWSADLETAEVALLWPEKSPLSVSATGNGTFRSDLAFTSLEAQGELHGDVDGLGTLVPIIARVGRTQFGVRFDARRSSGALQVNSLYATVGAREHPVLEVDLPRGVSVDGAGGGLGEDGTSGRITLRDFPVDWFPPFAGRFEWAKARLNGALTATFSAREAKIASVGSLTARGGTLLDRGVAIADNLDLVAPLTVTHARDAGWVIQSDDVNVSIGSQRLAGGRLVVKPIHEPYRVAEIQANARVDLNALRTLTTWRGVPGREATVELTGHLGAAADISAKVRVVANTPGVDATAQIDANIEDYRGVTLHMPATVTVKSHTSEFNVDGTIDDRSATRQMDLDVSGKTVDAEALRLVAASTPLAPLVKAFGATNEGATRSPSSRLDLSPAPFWKNTVGRLRVAMMQVNWNGHVLDAVEANFAFTADALLLNGAHASFNPVDLTKRVRRASDLEGSLEPISRFTADAKLNWHPEDGGRYQLDGTLSVDAIDGARIFGTPAAGHKPQVEGRWAIGDHFAATGKTLEELVRDRTESLTFASTGGAFRLLETSIGDALPDAPTPVSDTAAKVGSAVTWIFGMKRGALDRENRLPKVMESVLNFTYAIRELQYERASIEAQRGRDGAFQLKQIEVSAPNLRLVGSGSVAYAPRPIGDRPIQLKLELTVDGPYAKQLAGTGLLVETKEPSGGIRFREPIEITGTLNEPNKAAWHDQLAKAALAAGKK